MNKHFSPALDGIDHINVYSKAATKLGLFLSNFAHSPILTKDGKFESIEGYWYWLCSSNPRREELRPLYGYAAKKLGRELIQMSSVKPEGFEEDISKAILKKIYSYPEFTRLLRESTLPLTHYYVSEGRMIAASEGHFCIEFIEKIRRRLKGADLRYEESDLFSAPAGTVLAHSCNSVGVWGAGVAKTFKELFPLAHQDQFEACRINGPKMLGKMRIFDERNHRIASLFVSEGFGKKRSNPRSISDFTYSAICELLKDPTVKEVHIPKINSGLFGVAWEATEALLLRALARHPGKSITVHILPTTAKQ